MSVQTTYEDFLATQAPQIDVGQFVINLGTAGVLAGLMALLYSRWGRGQSHRGVFAGNFFLITMTTMLVISVVKSSLALSLGLVGALSVIRFRTAIKDPEELSFLFLAIAVGLGLGADQRGLTVIGLVVILAVYSILKIKGKAKDDTGSMYIHLSNLNSSLADTENVLRSHNKRVKLKRWQDKEAVFLVESKGTLELENMKKSLEAKSPGLKLLMTEYQDLT